MVDRIDGYLVGNLLPRDGCRLDRDRANVLGIDTLLRLIVGLRIGTLLRRRSKIDLVLWFLVIES